MFDVYHGVRVVGLNTLLNGGGHASRHTVTAACGGGILHMIQGLNLLHQDISGLKHAGQFLKGDDKIHIGTHRSAHSLQFLGCTGPNEYHQGVRMFRLDLPGRSYHGSQFRADLVDGLRKQMLCHHDPGGTAGSQTECLFACGNLIHIMFGLRYTARIRANGRFIHIRKAQFFQGRFEHIWRYF